eukprot:9481405-Pyramimonas_sp.AAC.1
MRYRKVRAAAEAAANLQKAEKLGRFWGTHRGVLWQRRSWGGSGARTAGWCGRWGVGLDTDTVKWTVKPLSSHLVAQKMNSPTDSLRTSYVRDAP